MERNNRLQIEDVLCSLVWPVAKIHIVLQWQTDEIADWILDLLGEIRCALCCSVVANNHPWSLSRLLCPSGRPCGRQHTGEQTRQTSRNDSAHSTPGPLLGTEL